MPKNKKPSSKRVIMAKNVATRWLKEHTAKEYRITVYETIKSKPIKNLVQLLRSFRDGKTKVAGLEPVTDLGLSSIESFGALTIWSTDHSKIKDLNDWLEKHGYDTTGVW